MTYRRLLLWNKLSVSERGRCHRLLTAPPLEIEEIKPDASLLEELTKVVLGARILDQFRCWQGDHEISQVAFSSHFYPD